MTLIQDVNTYSFRLDFALYKEKRFTALSQFLKKLCPSKEGQCSSDLIALDELQRAITL